MVNLTTMYDTIIISTEPSSPTKKNSQDGLLLKVEI